MCYILTFGPAKHAISKWCTVRKWHIPMASNRKKSRRWTRLIIWDKVEVPPCRYRVMHRKRVTSELHDSYFRLMTIKHAIPKIEWAIKWALNYYINQSRQLGIRDVGEKCGWESHTRPKGPSGPLMVFGDQLVIRYSKESHHPAESWAPGPPIEQPWRTRKTQRWRP